MFPSSVEQDFISSFLVVLLIDEETVDTYCESLPFDEVLILIDGTELIV